MTFQGSRPESGSTNRPWTDGNLLNASRGRVRGVGRARAQGQRGSAASGAKKELQGTPGTIAPSALSHRAPAAPAPLDRRWPRGNGVGTGVLFSSDLRVGPPDLVCGRSVGRREGARQDANSKVDCCRSFRMLAECACALMQRRVARPSAGQGGSGAPPPLRRSPAARQTPCRRTPPAHAPPAMQRPPASPPPPTPSPPNDPTLTE